MYTPTLRLITDVEQEVCIFIDFLNHPKFPQQKGNILRFFPALQEKLEAPERVDTDTEVVRSFLKEYYQSNKKIIEPILSDIENNLREHGAQVLATLATLMDYEWSPTFVEYKIIPTILPFSPFRDNTIFFSMARKIGANKNNEEDRNHDILPLVAHEVSHMLLRDILCKNHGTQLDKVYSWTTLHFLQELFAPTLMNQPELKELLGIQNYSGNPYLKPIMISYGDSTDNLVSYFSNIFQEERVIKGKSFTETALLIAALIKKIDPLLDVRLKLWNSAGHLLFKDTDKIKEYTTPIII